MFRTPTPVEKLGTFIQQKNFAEFDRYYQFLHQDKAVGRECVYQLHDDMSLFQVALNHGARHICEYLIANGYSEKRLPKSLRLTVFIKYIELLLSHLGHRQKLFELLDIITSHKEDLAFDINYQVNHLTLLQHACERAPGLIQALINYGCKLGLEPVNDAILNERRLSTFKFLLASNNIELTREIWTQILITAAYLNHMDYVECALRNHANPNGYTRLGYSALCYATEHNNLEMVKLLIRHGAAAGSSCALENAICHENVEMIEALLEIGAGSFCDVDERFLQLDVNASHCYVEGMTINHVAVTHETHGFHAAFLTVDELQQFVATQRKSIRIAHLKYNLQVCAVGKFTDTPEYMALDQMSTCSSTPSLFMLTYDVLKRHRYPYSALADKSRLSLMKYLRAKLMPGINAIEEMTEEQRRAVGILYDRLDELESFRERVSQEFRRQVKMARLHSALSVSGIYVSIGSTGLYGLISLILACVNSSPGAIGYSACFPLEFMQQNAMCIFGVPGISVGVLVVISALVSAAFFKKYGVDRGCHNVWCYEDFANRTLPVKNHPEIRDAINRLIIILNEENISPAMIMQQALLALPDLALPDLDTPQLISVLERLQNHYASSVIKRIYQDKSQIPYARYSRSRFFYNENQVMAARNNRLPTVMAMHDMPNADLQTVLGHELFEIMDSEPDDVPPALEMDDDVNQQESDAVPLLLRMN